jgi:hypothetical protein
MLDRSWSLRRRPLCLAASLILLAGATAVGQTTDRRATLATYRYDPAVPTLEQVVGHDHGTEVTSPEEIVLYVKALAAAAPTRTRLVEYGRTWEGRPLVLLAIASPERIAALDTITADLRRLADPRGLTDADATALVARTPVVVALLHSVHGNEISPAGAALLEAYHLLAARNDPRVDAIRTEAIVLIDPLQNPDGRGRFVQSTRAGRAAAPDALALSAEHDEPWPGGRGNHYFFDLNRDWFAHTQPESRGKVAALLGWMPHVVVDLHEMGSESTYYFPPNAVPGNTHTTPAQTASIERFGRAIAAAFDERGFPYFNREVFDAFYPGYGVSWPIAQGAIGMTFEKSSARGLAVRRDDGSVLTYTDGIVEHFTAALTTAHTAATARESLLRQFVAFRRSAIDEGERSAVRQYVLLDNGDRGRTTHLATLLHRNGIEVRRTSAAATVAGRPVPAGSFVVAHGQPAGRLVRNLLDERTAMPADFLAEQEARRRRRQPDQIYDVTAWSLPLLYDVETLRVGQPLAVETTPWTPRPATMTVPAARVAYLMPWNASTATAVAAALTQGVRVRVAGERFALGGRAYAVGTAIVRVADHPGVDLPKVLGEVAARSGAEVVPIDSGFAEEGISLGSNLVQPLRTPRVLLAWDVPANGLSAGWARYVLERRYGIVPSAVRVSALARVTLADFDVVVLPSGTYSPAIGGELLRRLKDWVSNGGTLVTIGDATRWAAGEAVGLVSTTAEWKGGAPATDTPAPRRTTGPAPAQPIDLTKAVEPARELPPLVPGAIANTVVDTEHWLTSGLDEAVPVSLQGQRIFSPLTLDKGRNVVVFAPRDRLLASGIIWDDSQAQLPGKPYLMHQPLGRGHVIAFTDDPNNRAFAEATQLLFANAVLLGPAM